MVIHNHSHHGHAHHHPAPEELSGGRVPPWRNARVAAAVVVMLALVLSACLVLVSPGEAIVISRFGNPVEVFTSPGVASRLPPPIDTTLAVDLRLRTTSSGLHDVGTRDGLRILIQAYIAWQVPDDAAHIRQFLRAVRNQPELAAEQLRSFTGSALEITASSFDLASLVNTQPSQIKLAQFESALRDRINEQALRVYGIAIRQVGLERLTLAPDTLNATIERMKAERDTVAAERSAQGQRQADLIRSAADRDARVVQAQAKLDAAEIEAKSRVEAASIYKHAYDGDPQLYTLLRSLDSLDAVVNTNTQLILRTDAAPFRVLVDGPGGAGPARVGRAP
jgi:modulator of FtsH protease HflC